MKVKNKITETADSARVFLDNNLNLLIRTVMHLIRRKLMEEANYIINTKVSDKARRDWSLKNRGM